MSALIIGAVERKAIAEAKKLALTRPVPLEVMRHGRLGGGNALTYTDRRKLNIRPPGVSVLIPVGYRANFSYEEQPGGLCSHLSIGVEGRKRRGMMPSPDAVKMICEEFGVPFPPNAGLWTEEYEPGEFAINLVSFVTPPKEGHA